MTEKAKELVRFVMNDMGYSESEPIKNSKELVLELLNSVKRDGMEALIRYLTKRDYFSAPASTRFHSNYEGGLADHSLLVYALFLMKNQQLGLGLPKETIIISALLHDLCKVDIYKKEFKNQKKYCENGSKWDPAGYFEWQTVQGWTIEDNLPLGHGEKSVILLQGFIKLTREEIYLIRWHMGPFSSANEYEFSRACEIFPPCVALYTADLEASHLYEEIGDLTPIT